MGEGVEDVGFLGHLDVTGGRRVLHNIQSNRTGFRTGQDRTGQDRTGQDNKDLDMLRKSSFRLVNSYLSNLLTSR